MADVEIKIGHENFGNYRRLSYKWWFALAEFVDNSTQSYLDNKESLDKRLDEEKESFKVTITTDQDFIRVHDTAMGMDIEDLRRAMVVGKPPANNKGRCRYGLGMKTAACWIGNEWTIITSKLGSDTEYTLSLKVDDIVKGNLNPPVDERAVDSGEHYTILEVRKHNRPLRGRTVGKIKDYLRSIYRQDISSGMMVLTYNDATLEWEGFPDNAFLTRADGSAYRDTFIFETASGKVADGWVGVLQKGSRAKAGFSILHRKRVVRGWPDPWRPEKIFGHGGRNDLINQRLVGEVNLEDFEVSHTKDEINWHGDEEEQVEEGLRKAIKQYMDAARNARKGQAVGHGPEPVHVAAAVKTLEAELATTEFMETLTLDDALPPEGQIKASNHHVVENASANEPAFRADLGDLIRVSVYLDDLGSPNDPYFVNEDEGDNGVVVVVNRLHPHWSMLEGENAVANFLRHCVYDAVAEYRAVRLARLDAGSIKRLKDSYLRVAFEVLQGDEGPTDE